MGGVEKSPGGWSPPSRTLAALRSLRSLQFLQFFAYPRPRRHGRRRRWRPSWIVVSQGNGRSFGFKQRGGDSRPCSLLLLLLLSFFIASRQIMRKNFEFIPQKREDYRSSQVLIAGASCFASSSPPP